jgi:MFS transporter, OFA family, oxalate/formate antiporter
MRAPVPPSARWAIAWAGAAVMLLIGTIYSWGIFTQPLQVAFQWDLTTTTWTYAIANFSLAAVGTLLGGFWQDRVGPRRVAMLGVGLWGCGNLLAGFGTPAFGAPWLYLTYGLIGGVGAGMAYVAPLAMVAKWFPDRRGLAGGLVAGGFGLGAFIYNQCIPRLAGFHEAAVHAGNYIAARSAAQVAGIPFDRGALTVAQTPTTGDMAAVMHVFIGSGLAYLLIGVPAAALFRDPPAEYRVAGRGAAAHIAAITGYPPSRVLAMPQFYLLWLQLFGNVVVGITIISNAVCILVELTQLSAAVIAPLFGVVSVFNAAGRFFWGAISDRIGCNRTFAAMFAVQAATLLLLSAVHQLVLALAGISVVLLCCGGGFGTMPSYNAQYFGTRYVGRNYGLLLSAWGVAGLIGPIVIARVKDLSGSFAGVMPMVAAMLLACVVLPCITRKPVAA